MFCLEFQLLLHTIRFQWFRQQYGYFKAIDNWQTPHALNSQLDIVKFKYLVKFNGHSIHFEMMYNLKQDIYVTFYTFRLAVKAEDRRIIVW